MVRDWVHQQTLRSLSKCQKQQKVTESGEKCTEAVSLDPTITQITWNPDLPF